MTNPFATAETALFAVISFAVFALGLRSTDRVKQHGDPVRRGFYWYYNSLWLFFFAGLLSLISLILFMVRYYNYDGDYNDTYTRSEGSFSPTRRIAVTSRLALIWSYVSLLVCTCRLTVGAKLAATHSVAGSKKFAISIYILAAFASLLSFASFCGRQYRPFGTDGYDAATAILSLLGFIAIILLCAASLGVFVFSLIARKAIKEQAPVLLKVADRLIIVSGINTIVFAWTIAAVLLIGIGDGARVQVGPWALVDLIISYVGPFASLVLIYFLGKKNEGGLWSG